MYVIKIRVILFFRMLEALLYVKKWKAALRTVLRIMIRLHSKRRLHCRVPRFQREL